LAFFQFNHGRILEVFVALKQATDPASPIFPPELEIPQAQNSSKRRQFSQVTEQFLSPHMLPSMLIMLQIDALKKI
jgi:hypothetical protein